MGDVGSNGSPGGAAPPDRAEARGPRRTPWPLVLLATLFVVVPFLTWYWTWFGRTLGDEEIEKYLREGKPRQAQHALSQVADRVAAGDAGAARWFPSVAALADNPSTDLRMTAAWVMGVEHRSEEFRAALLRLVADPEPIVRRNAALALVRFGDARCRPELLAMLRPYAVEAPADGTAETALSVGTPVKRESLLVRLATAGGGRVEVRSPVPGRVEKVFAAEGASVRKGEPLFLIAPDSEQARDALIGLAYFGEPEDLALVSRYESGVEHLSDDVKRQAALTAEAIRRRSQGK